MGSGRQAPVADLLARPVHAGDRSTSFGALTQAEVAERAAELRSAVGWGPMARVAAVARAWGQLARAMESAGAATVADLDPEAVAGLAAELWVVPPGGTLLP